MHENLTTKIISLLLLLYFHSRSPLYLLSHNLINYVGSFQHTLDACLPQRVQDFVAPILKVEWLKSTSNCSYH